MSPCSLSWLRWYAGNIVPPPSSVPIESDGRSARDGRLPGPARTKIVASDRTARCRRPPRERVMRSRHRRVRQKTKAAAVTLCARPPVACRSADRLVEVRRARRSRFYDMRAYAAATLGDPSRRPSCARRAVMSPSNSLRRRARTFPHSTRECVVARMSSSRRASTGLTRW